MAYRVAAGLLVLVAGPALSWAQVPAGPEFRVNTYTTGSQGSPAVAATGKGDFAAVWNSFGQDGEGDGIIAQRFSASGALAGVEFQVNDYTTASQTTPAITAHANGDFVVAWTSNGQDGSSHGLFGQRFGAAGERSGDEFAINTYSTSRQEFPAIAADSNRGLVVVWTSSEQDGDFTGSFGRRFDGSGAPLGGEFQINTITTGDQSGPSVASDRDGNFVVVWQTLTGPPNGVFAQRFSAAGNPLGAVFNLAMFPSSGPRVARDWSGAFVVVWTTFGDAGGDRWDVLGWRFSASGAPLGGRFRVNAYTTGDQLSPGIAADAAGNFVVTWTSLGQDGSGSGVFAQRFASSGLPRGPEFRVNGVTTADQDSPAVAADLVGNFMIVWQGASQDGSGTGAFGQRFGGLLPSALAVDTMVNGVLEPGESVDVRPSWRNVNGAAQTFAAALSNIGGPAGATYAITDGTGNYGTVSDGSTAPCTDCYGVSVSDPAVRPVPHWDASAVESIIPDMQGQQKIWALHVGRSFTDVPTTSAFYPFVETLLHHSVTGGCGADTYCPSSSTTREQMAVFVLVAKEGAGYSPSACTAPVFGDVPASSPFCHFIEELARRGVVSGCGGGNYCPQDPVTREQMAIFVLRTLDPASNPPACTTPTFADVPASSPFCRWIEELARRGVVSGCGGGNYCPTNPVTREQMGVFLGVSFGLTLYRP